MIRRALRTPIRRAVACFSVILIFATSSIPSLGASGEANAPVATEWVNTMPGFPGRSIHTAVLHQASGRMIVFGGNDGLARNDLWYLDNAAGSAAPPVWGLATPTNTPPPGRFAHSAVYGETSNRMTVFGGHSGSTWKSVV